MNFTEQVSERSVSGHSGLAWSAFWDVLASVSCHCARTWFLGMYFWFSVFLF
jgi:hypothetical protein